jgi:hypothetical protein
VHSYKIVIRRLPSADKLVNYNQQPTKGEFDRKSNEPLRQCMGCTRLHNSRRSSTFSSSPCRRVRQSFARTQ